MFITGISETDSEFWTMVGSVAAIASVIIGLLIFLPKRAKLKILKVHNCFIAIGESIKFPPYFFGERVQFELLVDNSTGSRNCSITSIKLKLPDESFVELNDEKSTKLPLIISTDKPEKVVMYGFLKRTQWLNGDTGMPTLDMSPKQNSIEATIIIKVNTKKYPIKYPAIFIIKRFSRI